MLWGFLGRYIPGATPQTQPLLDRLAGYALNYYEDFVRAARSASARRTRASAAAWQTWRGRLARPAGRATTPS